MTTNNDRPIKRIHLTQKEQEAFMQAAEVLRERVDNSPYHHALVVIERKGNKFQIYALQPTLFIG